jgi:hypothetical protein
LFALRSDGQSITPTGGLVAKPFLLIISHFLMGGAIAMRASQFLLTGLIRRRQGYDGQAG